MRQCSFPLLMCSIRIVPLLPYSSPTKQPRVGQDSPLNMDRAIISQYTDLKREKLDIEDKIQTLDSQISAIEGHLSTLTEDEKRNLLVKKLLLGQRKACLSALELEIMVQTNEVEEFISQIEDSLIRRIIDYRVIEGKSWNDVAAKLGNTSVDSAKKMYYRF